MTTFSTTIAQPTRVHMKPYCGSCPKAKLIICNACTSVPRWGKCNVQHSWSVVAQEARPHELKGIADVGQNRTLVRGKKIYIWINVHVVMRKRGGHVTIGNGSDRFGSRGSWFRIRINIFLNVHIFCIVPNINIDFLGHGEQGQKSKVSIYISHFFGWHILFLALIHEKQLICCILFFISWG